MCRLQVLKLYLTGLRNIHTVILSWCSYIYTFNNYFSMFSNELYLFFSKFKKINVRTTLMVSIKMCL